MEKNSNLAELYAKRSQMKDIGIMLFCCLKMKFFKQLSNTDPCPKHQSIANVWSLSRSRPEADPSSIKSRNRLQPSAALTEGFDFRQLKTEPSNLFYIMKIQKKPKEDTIDRI